LRKYTVALKERFAGEILALSDGQFFSEAFGQDILEIVLFILVENAVKYSFNGAEIFVDVSEIDDSVIISVSSWGPCIAANETVKIFERGYRGLAAERMSKARGSGIGLFAARSIVEGQFLGNLTVKQDAQNKLIDGVNFYQTSFLVSLPIARKVPPKTFRRRRFFRA